ncbi:sigma-70 family RNA polymerase sigma factor [Luteimonas viscosa]|uniref:Sigma-70 family RNA polymerase sigma factor n=1 Tax=Luteimonas viscosa TaxID=1132694 RepID=A0A5D4XMD7_9GAMM|nr:sigma-70 family RNA polymerase sigma factor [Luteimonas viscosa]TYT25294.1 sigma-70 family RNA polymerase sigma factor [Luteimonas viscosa]
MDHPTPTAGATHATFDELLQRHRGMVLKVANSYANGAENRADLAQEIAAQLWRAWPGYDPSRSFSTWMYRIALNTAISFLRGERQRRRHAVPLDERLHDLADERAVDHESDDRLRLLWRFMETLGALDRALLVLYLEERTTREIAEVLGLGESNVTTKISRLKQRIRDYAAPSATS